MILHHFCQQCGHPDYYHSTAECSYGLCKCPVAEATMTPETAHGPTWDTALRPVLTVTPPGTKWPPQGHGHKTCACNACVLEYQRLTGGAA